MAMAYGMTAGPDSAGRTVRDRAFKTADMTLSASVLIIDDDPIVREGLEMVLQDWGLSVLSAGSLLDADRAIRTAVDPVDLIIADYHLADGPSGLDGLDQLVQCSRNAPACLVITGSTDREALRRIEASGVPRLHKPVSPRALRQVLDDLLGRG